MSLVLNERVVDIVKVNPIHGVVETFLSERIDESLTGSFETISLIPGTVPSGRCRIFCVANDAQVTNVAESEGVA